MRVVFVLGLLVLASCQHSRVSRTPLVPPTPAPEAEREDQPGAAAEHYVADRVPAGADQIPVDRYFTARDRMSRMRLYSSRQRSFVPEGGKNRNARDASLGQWTSLGPGNAGGRIRALVIHPLDPNIMYTAGVAGGVWKSVDGGGSWFPLTDFLPNIAVNALAMDPSNFDVLYAGTGEGYNNRGRVRGAGIFKTTDGGATWTRLENSNRSTLWYVNRIVVSKADPNRVYAATWTGIYRSLNAGQSFTQVLSISNALGCQDLVIHTEENVDTLFAACQGSPQGSIYRNTNAGGDGAWQAVFTAQHMARVALAIAPSRPRTIYAIAESSMPGACPGSPGARPPGQCFRLGLLALWRSTEGGDPDTWEERTSNQSENPINPGLLTNSQGYYRDLCTGGVKTFSSQGWYDMAIAVDPFDAEIVWVGGIDLFRSNDGGANFGMASFWNAARDTPSWVHSDQHLIVFHPNYNGDSNQAVYVVNDGGVFVTQNARAEVANGAQGPCRSTNTQVRWANLNNNLGVTQFYHGTVFPGGHAFIGGTQDNATQLGLAADGPNRWNYLIGGDGGYVAVNPRDPRIVFGATTNLSLRRSDNGTATFVSATSGIAEPSSNFDFSAPYRLDPQEPERMWIGGRSLWRSPDSARTWTKASAELNANSAVNAIAISPVDPNRILAGTRDGRVYRTDQGLTSDGDTVFESVRPRAAGVVSSLEFHPTNPNIAWATYSNFNSATSDRHVYKTEDGGATWTGLDGTGDSAIPDLPVHHVLAHPENPETLYAGTDLGVFVSLDGGASWAREDLGVPYTTVETLVLEKSGSGYYLFAFTHGRGAYRVWLGPGEPCTYELTSTALQVPRASSRFAIEINTQEGCRWSALPSANWLTFPDPPVGTGPGRIEVNAATFTGNAQSRRGVVWIADKAVAVTQQ